jgi:hypothetical protein
MGKLSQVCMHSEYAKKKKKKKAGCQWHTPVILATQEAEIRMIVVWCQPRQRVLEVLAQKHPSQKRAGRVAQGEGPEFKPQHWKKKKEGEESQIQPAFLSPYFIISWLSSYLSCLVYRYSLITVLTRVHCVDSRNLGKFSDSQLFLVDSNIPQVRLLAFTTKLRWWVPFATFEVKLTGRVLCVCGGHVHHAATLSCLIGRTLRVIFIFFTKLGSWSQSIFRSWIVLWILICVAASYTGPQWILTEFLK